ncbi:MAG TPA: protein kinase [Isosphaeraceae bacterium]|nr:protein kinase [Isosphaeraceae bacterium]
MTRSWPEDGPFLLASKAMFRYLDKIRDVVRRLAAGADEKGRLVLAEGARMMSENSRQDTCNGREGGPETAVLEVPGYEILRRIGRGGMGEVYVARQLTLGRLVALKVLMPQGEADTPNDLVRFRREAELMAKVSHPNILSIFDFGEVDGRPYLVMEYVEGGDLRRLLHPGQPMSANQVRSIALPVGEALAYLHRQEIIHRDLKPENILLHDGANPRVSDFGIAVLRAGSGALTRTGWAAGTLGYVAPEQQYRLKVDERADQFSLAAMAYEMLTGQLPLGIFKPPSQLNRRLSPAVDAVILRALHESPKDRFSTIREFTAALDLCLAAKPARSWRSASHRLAWMSLGLVVLAGAAGLSLSWRTPGASRPTEPIRPGQRQALRPVADTPTTQAATRQDPTPAGKGSSPVAVSTAPPAQPKVQDPAQPPKPAPSLAEELKQLRAHQIWKQRGSPTGAKGEAVKEEIWFAATRSIEKELKELAYQIWEKRGSPKGAAGEAVKDEIWAEAERRLFKKLSGKDPLKHESR